MPLSNELKLSKRLAGKRPPKPRAGKGRVFAHGRRLTLRELAFVERYIATLNGTQSVIDAGYVVTNRHGAGVQAARLLSKEDVSSAIKTGIEKRLRPLHSTPDRVIEEASRLAHSDIRRLFDAKGNLRPIHELEDDIASALSSIEVVENKKRNADGEIEVEYVRKIRTWDKPAALGLLARYHKLLTDTTVVKHEGLTPAKVAGFSDDELRDQLTALQAQIATLQQKL